MAEEMQFGTPLTAHLSPRPPRVSICQTEGNGFGDLSARGDKSRCNVKRCHCLRRQGTAWYRTWLLTWELVDKRMI